MLLRDSELGFAQLVHQCVFIDFLKVPSAWSTVRAQPMIRLDRRLTLSAPASICVFCVLCGSIFLAYCRHNLANSLTNDWAKSHPALAAERRARKRVGALEDL